MRAIAVVVVLIASCVAFAARAGDLEANKRLVREVIQQAFNQRCSDALNEFVAENYIEHNPHLPQGLTGAKQFNVSVLAGFSDYHGTIEDIMAEGEKVMVRIHWTGTQDGPFQGLPPSMHKLDFFTADIFRVQDRKLAEHWDVVDSLPLALALGSAQLVAPPLPAAK